MQEKKLPNQRKSFFNQWNNFQVNYSQKQNLKKYFLISFIVFSLLIVVFLLKKIYVLREIVTFENNNLVSFEPEPTPFPFQELTIPHLKKRTYTSQISELEQYFESSNYISYLTGYDSDGLKINGLLTIPTTPKLTSGYPAIVFVHGYIAPNVYRTEQNYNSYVDYFASRGFVVFKIDLRGHDESDGEASGAYYSSDYVIDVLHAYSALQKLEGVDQSRVGLWGHSMAGNVVLRALAAKPEIPKVVIWAGAVYSYEDFSEFGISDDSYRPSPVNSERSKKREELNNLYGQFDSNSWFWQQVPATNYLSEIQGEIQIHHAVNDDVVSIEYSRNLMKLLANTEIVHQLFEYSSGGHNLTGDYFVQAMQRSVNFYLD